MKVGKDALSVVQKGRGGRLTRAFLTGFDMALMRQPLQDTAPSQGPSLATPDQVGQKLPFHRSSSSMLNLLRRTSPSALRPPPSTTRRREIWVDSRVSFCIWMVALDTVSKQRVPHLHPFQVPGYQVFMGPISYGSGTRRRHSPTPRHAALVRTASLR
ncbi:hypothetical protein LZ30DRAFT_292529 [Colletotrichum cereale]|nr:hypothetical protein LZ30DRAFT_292529 [Colletotrichum cereale]